MYMHDNNSCHNRHYPFCPCCCHDRCCSGHDHYFHHRCLPLLANLAGLQGSINFQLLRLKGCRVKVHVECAGQNQVIMGRICNVGTNFVSIHVDKRQPGEKIVTVMTERICLIEWPDKNCSPCKDRKSSDSCNLYD